MEQVAGQGTFETSPAAPGGAVGEAVISETQWGAVRALWGRGLSRERIALELGLDIKTVRRWLRESWRFAAAIAARAGAGSLRRVPAGASSGGGVHRHGAVA